MEGYLVVIVRGSDSDLCWIEMVLIEEVLLVGVLHHLQVLFDVAIEDLAPYGLLACLYH
jgi:hypothetical protein